MNISAEADCVLCIYIQGRWRAGGPRQGHPACADCLVTAALQRNHMPVTKGRILSTGQGDPLIGSSSARTAIRKQLPEWQSSARSRPLGSRGKAAIGAFRSVCFRAICRCAAFHRLLVLYKNIKNGMLSPLQSGFQPGQRR